MKKEIGKKLKLERVRQDLTIEDVAKGLGVSKSLLSIAERGHSGFGILSKEAKFLGFDLIIHQHYELKKHEDD